MSTNNLRPTNLPDLRRVEIHPDFWYPLAQSKELKKNKTLGVTFSGEPIVLVRTASDRVFALEDRCAHRQVPLHLGVVAGEQLQCCYHSWCYEPSGKVAGIPYLPKASRVPLCVKSYPCRDAFGLIWVFPGAPEKANAAPFPEFRNWNSSQHKPMYFSRRVNCHYSFMHENLIDMNHQFLHRRLMGNIKAELLHARKGPHWIEVDYKFQSIDNKRHFGAGLMLGPKDTDPNKRNYDIMSIRTEYPYQILSVRRPSSNDPAFQLWAVYVPIDKEQRVSHTFGILMIRKPRIPGFIELFWPAIRYFTEMIFAEDRVAVEAEQQAHDHQGADWNQEVYPVILDLKQLLRDEGIVAEEPRVDKLGTTKLSLVTTRVTN